MTNKLKIILSCVIAILVIAMIHFFGNSADVHMFGHSTFYWMITRWGDYGGSFSYCYFIPFISLWLIWQQRREILQAAAQVDPRALAVIVAALLLQIISIRTRQPRLSILALIMLTWSIPWYLRGWQTAKILIFPCTYLLFCIPLTFLDSLTFPMRLIAASTSTFFLNGFGIETIRVGTGIISTAPNGFRLDVADPCSGLRYFLVLLALSALYGHLTQKTILKQWLVFLASPIIAITANIIRIFVIAFAAEIIGQDRATGLYHDFSGYIVFVSAVLLLMGFSKLINTDYRQVLRSWRRQVKNKNVSRKDAKITK